MRDPDDNDRFCAAQLGHALHVAHVIADHAESAPAGHEAQILATLRQLLNAIDAVAPRPHRGEEEAGLTGDESDFIDSTGIPVTGFTDSARQQAEDWVLWSALRDHAVHIRLDQLAENSALLIIPELHRVIDAFPRHYTDLDKFRFLRRPDEQLDGLSPLRWLLLGRPAPTVTKIVTDLNWLP
jgi:hypothetical protein